MYVILPDFGASYLAVVVVTSFVSTTLVGGSAVSLTSSRWVYPCSGGMVVEGVGSSVSGLVIEEAVGVPAAVNMVDSVDWYSTLQVLEQCSRRRLVYQQPWTWLTRWIGTVHSMS